MLENNSYWATLAERTLNSIECIETQENQVSSVEYGLERSNISGPSSIQKMGISNNMRSFM